MKFIDRLSRILVFAFGIPLSAHAAPARSIVSLDRDWVFFQGAAPGAGIYRHVRLVSAHPVHVEPWGVFITTPNVSETTATVNIQTSIENLTKEPTKITLRSTLVAPDGKTISSLDSDTTLAAGQTNSPPPTDPNFKTPVMESRIAGVSRSLRPHGHVCHVGILRLLDQRKESPRLSFVLQTVGAHRPARGSPARPQSPERDSLQRGQ